MTANEILVLMLADLAEAEEGLASIAATSEIARGLHARFLALRTVCMGIAHGRRPVITDVQRARLMRDAKALAQEVLAASRTRGLRAAG